MLQTPTKGIIAYKGIPFAAPPVGEPRWKEPQPVVPWEGVKAADKYGAAAVADYMGSSKFLWQENGEPAAVFRLMKIVSI